MLNKYKADKLDSDEVLVDDYYLGAIKAKINLLYKWFVKSR